MVTAKQDVVNTVSSLKDALDVIGGKWRLRIIIAVRDGDKRFKDIRSSVEGISPKVLSGELRRLEVKGLIERTVYTGRPVVVEYMLTEFGQSFDGVISAFISWGSLTRFKG